MIKNLLIVMIVVLSACTVTKNGNTKALKLVKAEKQSYTLGRELKNGKTSGTTYSIYFNINGKIKVQKVWINGVNIDFEQVKTSESSSIRVRSTFYNGTKTNRHYKVKEPIEYEGDALIEYKENDETKYFILKEFKEFKKVEGAR